MLCMEDRIVVAHGCRKTERLICGIEGENVVAYGRLPSPFMQVSFLLSAAFTTHFYGKTTIENN